MRAAPAKRTGAIPWPQARSGVATATPVRPFASLGFDCYGLGGSLPACSAKVVRFVAPPPSITVAAATKSLRTADQRPVLQPYAKDRVAACETIHHATGDGIRRQTSPHALQRWVWSLCGPPEPAFPSFPPGNIRSSAKGLTPPHIRARAGTADAAAICRSCGALFLSPMIPVGGFGGGSFKYEWSEANDRQVWLCIAHPEEPWGWAAGTCLVFGPNSIHAQDLAQTHCDVSSTHTFKPRIRIC